MPLSPLDIESRRFKRELFGYSKAEVDAFLSSVSDTLSRTILERDELSRKVQRLLGEVDEFRQRERTLIEALSAAERLAEERKALAEQEARQIVNDARQRSDQMIARTRAEVSRVEQQIIRLKVEREGFENRLAAMINEHRRLIDIRRREVASEGPPTTPQRSTLPPPHAREGER